MPHRLADLLVDAQHPSGLIDLDDADSNMFVGGSQRAFALFTGNSGEIRNGARCWHGDGLGRPLLDVHSPPSLPQGQILRHAHASAWSLTAHKSARRKLFPAMAGRRPSSWAVVPRRRAQFDPLAPAADPLEATHLCWPPPPSRRLARVTSTRTDDQLRGACVGRRHQARARRRIDRAVGDGRRWRAGAEWRGNRSVTDTAGIGERPGIGRAERHARYRRIAGAGRAGWRRQLCECPRGGDQGERHEQNQRRIAGHRGQYLQGALIQRSCGARVPSLPGRLLFKSSAFPAVRPATE